MKQTANRYHDFCAGHRVVGHESKCQHLHGHNYRVHFYCEAQQLDSVGRVIDFSVIKEKLCNWLENHWDHKFLAWKKDPLLSSIVGMYADATLGTAKAPLRSTLIGSVIWLPFNPTAENMSEYLLNVIGPAQLKDTGVDLVKVVIEETRKCSVTVEK